MTADEILKELENIPAIQVEENNEETQYCEIDPVTREIYVPDQYAVIGVESDEKSNRIYFHCPKIVGDNIDLSALQLRVNFRNAIGDDTINAKDQYIVDDVETDGDYITFSWLLSRKVTKYKGEIDFIVCAVRVSGETITNEWNTTLAHSEVLEGLEVTVPQPSEEESDVIAQLLEIMSTTSAQAVEDVEEARTTALSDITTEKTESKQEILDYTQDMISTIPSDYTEMTEKVWYMDAHKAPAILETASGESLTIEDSGDAAIPGLKVYGKGVQYQGTSKNLFDLEKFLKDRGADYTKNADGSITLNTWKQDLFSNPEEISEENETFSLSVISISGTCAVDLVSAAGDVYTVRDTVKKQENKSVNRIRIDFPSSLGFQKTTFKGIMLNEGATALPYEPYTGGQPAPSPDYPQEIKIPGSDGEIQVHTVGKNLVNYKNIERNGSYATPTVIEDGFTLNGTWYALIKGVKLKRRTQYYFSFEYEGGTYAVTAKVFKHDSNSGAFLTMYSNQGTFYNVDEDIVDLYFYAADNTPATRTFKNIVLQEGSYAGPYVPYQGESDIPLSTPNGLPGIPVDSGGNYTDEEGQQWVCDEIDLERGKYIQRVVKVEFDGSEDEDWKEWLNSNEITNRFYNNLSYFANSDVSTSKSVSMCNAFLYINNDSDKEHYRFSTDSGEIKQFLIYINKERASDLTELRSWLGLNHVVMIYHLKNPVETDLGPEEIAAFRSARTYPTVTNVMTDSETPPGLEVTYAADTKTWIENKLTEIVQTQAATNAQILKEV